MDKFKAISRDQYDDDGMPMPVDELEYGHLECEARLLPIVCMGKGRLV